MFSEKTIRAVVVDCVMDGIKKQIKHRISKHAKNRHGCSGKRLPPLRVYLQKDKVSTLIDTLPKVANKTALRSMMIKRVLQLGKKLT